MANRKTETPAAAAAAAEAPAPRRYFIVNPSGCVHEVTREHAAVRLKQVGWRMATADEAERYLGTPVQEFDRPIGRPHTTDPDAAME